MFACCGNRDSDKLVKIIAVNLKEESAQRITYEQENLPLLSENDVLVTVQFSTISVRDKTKFEGGRGIGNTFSGTIKKIGLKVTGLTEGRQVYGWCENGWGVVSESVVVPADHLVLTPAEVTQELACTLPILQIWDEHARNNLSPFTSVHIQSSNPLISIVLEEAAKFCQSPVIGKDKIDEAIDFYYHVDGDILSGWEKNRVQISYDIDLPSNFKRLTDGSRIRFESLKGAKVNIINKKEQLQEALNQILQGKTNMVIVDVGLLKTLELATIKLKSSGTPGK